MFGTDDDLDSHADLSIDAGRQRASLDGIDRAVRNFRLAMAIVLMPCVVVLAFFALRDDAANRWITFGITVGILLAIAMTLELTIVRPQRRDGRRSIGLD